MPIQIRCTCQQILSVDEAHQGQVVGCPYCGTQLTVPVIQQQPPGYPASPPGYPQQPAPNYPPQNPTSQPGQNPYQQSPPAAPTNNPYPGAQAPGYPAPVAPSFPTSPATPPASSAPSMPFLDFAAPAKSGAILNELTRDAPNVPGDWAEESSLDDLMLWHIPCPKGHLLETPNDMLDQEVLCPYCETQFTLRKFQSVEETEKRELARALRDELSGQFWLKLAIGIAAVVILGVIIMIAVAASK